MERDHNLFGDSRPLCGLIVSVPCRSILPLPRSASVSNRDALAYLHLLHFGSKGQLYRAIRWRSLREVEMKRRKRGDVEKRKGRERRRRGERREKKGKEQEESWKRREERRRENVEREEE